MKTSPLPFLLLSFLLLLTACSENNNTEDPPEQLGTLTYEGTEYAIIGGGIHAFGEHPEGVYNYLLFLHTAGISIAPGTGYDGMGTYAVFGLLSDKSTGPEPGTYPILGEEEQDEAGKATSIEVCVNKDPYVPGGGLQECPELYSGSITLARDGKNYILTFSARQQASDPENKTCTLDFEGELLEAI